MYPHTLYSSPSETMYPDSRNHEPSTLDNMYFHQRYDKQVE